MLDYLLITPAELISQSLVLVAFAAAISITALAYMAGEFFSMPTLKGFAKTELAEMGVSAIVLVLAIILIIPGGPFDKAAQGFMVNAPIDRYHTCVEWQKAHGTVDTISGNWVRSATDPGNDAFAQADYFLGCKPRFTDFITLYKNIIIPGAGAVLGFGNIWNDMFDGVMVKKLSLAYASLMMTEMFTGLLSGFYTGLHIPVWKVIAIDAGLNPWIALTPLNQFHTIIVDVVGNTYAAFVGQKMLLTFVENTMLTVFLPFGILLRTFPFTRRTGSTIIALVFAAYFIYPISVLVSQQVLEMIVNPPPSPSNPSCKGVGISCSTDLDCCSYDCREKPMMPGKQCVSQLTDFSEYRSIFGMCNDRHGGDLYSLLDKQMMSARKFADEENKAVEETYFGGTATSSKWTKPEARLKEWWSESKRKTNAFLSFFGATGMVLPNPGLASQSVFNSIEVLLLDVGQLALLSILFIVLEIIITMTMFKDFAVMIGGEPRLFGIGKLV